MLLRMFFFFLKYPLFLSFLISQHRGLSCILLNLPLVEGIFGLLVLIWTHKSIFLLSLLKWKTNLPQRKRKIVNFKLNKTTCSMTFRKLPSSLKAYQEVKRNACTGYEWRTTHNDENTGKMCKCRWNLFDVV